MARTTVLISSHFPYLPVKVTVKQRIFDVEALLDTGFDGEIILPSGLATNGELPYWYVDCKLANESVVKIPAFKCSLKLANKKINEVTAIIAKGSKTTFPIFRYSKVSLLKYPQIRVHLPCRYY